MIVGASLSDSFDESERAESDEEIAIYALERTAPGRVEIRKPDFERENAVETLDYPDVAAAVAEAVASGKADKGILICGTGVGMCVAANKIRGVRAALCCNEVAAEFSRRHNDANVLCIGGKIIGSVLAMRIVEVWMSTDPLTAEKYVRRRDKVAAIDAECTVEK